jgi:stress response protein YsnF
VPVNTVVAEAVPPREEGDTLIVPIFEEVLVTEKRLLLREEVHIVRRRVEVRAPQTITLRKENVDVHRIEDERPLDAQTHTKTGDQ